MEELLYIVVHYGITNVSLYQVPVSQLHSTEVSLIGVSAITLEHKWPYLNDYPQLEDLKQQMYTKTGLATIRGGPTLMYFAGYNESGIMCTDASCPKELHNIDTISVSVDPEWAFTMQLWQNAENMAELTKTAVWISSSRPRRFYYFRKSNHSEEYFFKEYLISFVYSNQILPIDSSRVLLCAHGENQMMISDSDKCDKKLKWLSNVRTGFTDKKWLRMFTSDKVYIFEQKAFQKVGTPHDLFERSFEDFFKCKESGKNNNSNGVNSLAIPIVVIVFCFLLAATALIWFLCIKKRKASKLKKGGSNLVAKNGKILSTKKKSSTKKSSKEQKVSKERKDSKERNASSSNLKKNSAKKSSQKGSSKKGIVKTKDGGQKRSVMTTVKPQLLSINKKASVNTQKASQQQGTQQPSVKKAPIISKQPSAQKATVGAQQPSAQKASIGTRKASVGTSKKSVKKTSIGTRKASVGTRKTSIKKASIGTRKASIGTRKASIGTRKTSAQKIPTRKASLGTRKTSVGTRKASLGSRKTSARKASIGTRKSKDRKHSKQTLKTKSRKASTQTKVSKDKKATSKQKRPSSRKTTKKTSARKKSAKRHSKKAAKSKKSSKKRTSKGQRVESKRKHSLGRRASSKKLNERKTSKAKKTISRKGSMKSKKTAKHSLRRKGTK